MKKAEMEIHRSKYHDLMDEARKAEREGLYRKAIEFALSAWNYIDGMMQYERKYEDKDFTSIPAVEMILKYAPLLFDFQNLDALENILKNCRRIEKNTSVSLVDKLAEARTRMWDNHRLWDYIERNPNARQDGLRRILGGDQNQWRLVAATWEKMGLLRRSPEGSSYQLALSTRLGELVHAKCPSCGENAEAPKAMFLEKLTCPNCKVTVLFVMRSSVSSSDIRE